jgi:hypothetical protein
MFKGETGMRPSIIGIRYAIEIGKIWKEIYAVTARYKLVLIQLKRRFGGWSISIFENIQ